MQRIAGNHTSTWLRPRPKHKMDGETSDYQSDNNLMRQFTNSYMNTRTWGITRDGQGYHHLPPTPQLWSTITSEGPRIPEHRARV
jgi:hypothetical protein